MKALRLPGLLSALLLLLPLGAGSAPAWRCEQQGVEMLIGGDARACHAVPAAARPGVQVEAPASMRIQRGVQTERDRERRTILQDELREEQLRSRAPELDAQARRRAELNVEALRRELARLGV